MHSSNCPAITPCSCCGRARERSAVFSQRWLAIRSLHNTLFPIIPVWSWWPCLVQPCGPQAWSCFDVRILWWIMFCPSPLGGTIIYVSCSPPPPLPLHSWSCSLLSCNCSSVLGNGGRKSQSFHHATMTIKKNRGEEKRKKVFQLRWKKEGGLEGDGGVAEVEMKERAAGGRTVLVMAINA